MKTRVWKVLMFLHDEPGYDEDGQPEPFLTRKELEKEIQAIGPQCYGLKVHAMEVTRIGSIEARNPSRRSRAFIKPLQLIPRKIRKDKGAKREPYGPRAKKNAQP